MKNRRHDIERYLRGELSAEEMHALERAALDDPFLAEALEGADEAGANAFLYDLHRIRGSVEDRLRRRGRRSIRTLRLWNRMSGVVATLLLIAIAGFYAVTVVRQQQQSQQHVTPAAPSSDSLDGPSVAPFQPSDTTNQKKPDRLTPAARPN